ncbi:MAG: hypothetical protein M5U28_50925 [Sandaracinaceae bacterium]|nr:hypothetical protein [Sandaracinaceae bacterium]
MLLPRLSADVVAFLRGSVSIVAASSGADGLPDLARAVGCRVRADRGRVTVLVASSQSSGLLESVRLTRRVAVVFTQPSTHRALQLKADDAVVEARGEDDARLVAAYQAAMVPELAKVGFGEDFARAMFGAAPDDLVAIGFSPAAVFEQTPGPRAGERIEDADR